MTISLPDTRAQLLFPNVSSQSEAFSKLISAVKTTKDAKQKTELVALFWECLSDYGSTVSRWASESIEGLSKDGLLPHGDDLLRECTRALSPSSSVQSKNIIRTLLHLSSNPIICALEIQNVNGELGSDIIDCLFELNMNDDDFVSTGAILSMRTDGSIGGSTVTHPFFGHRNPLSYPALADLLNDSSLWLLVSRNREYEKSSTLVEQFLSRLFPSTLKSISTTIDPIVLSRSLSITPSILLNPSIQSDTAMIPSLLEICSVERELGRVPCGGHTPDVLNQAKKLLMGCQSKGAETHNRKSNRDIRDGLIGICDWIGNDERRIKLWMEYVIKADFTPSIDTISILSALLPSSISSHPQLTMKVMISIAERAPHLANTLFLLCLTLLSKPWLKVDRHLVLETIAGLVTHRTMVAPVLKILVMVCQSSADRMISIDLIGNLVEKYPTSIGDQLESVTMIKDGEDIDWSMEKLRLIGRICVSSDGSDSYLSMMTNLLKKGGDLLPSTIRVIAQLCKMEELDLSPVAAQIREKIKRDKEGSATVAFLELLSIAATVEEEEEIQSKFALECSSFSTHSLSTVRAAAWKAMGAFPIHMIIPSLEDGDVMQAFVDRLKVDDASDEEKKEFSSLIRAMLQYDVENLPRPLYTMRVVREDDMLSSLLPQLSPLLSSMSPLSSICLYRPLCYMQPADKRLQYSITLYRTLLSTADMPNEEGKLEWMAGWRDATKTLVSLIEPTIDDKEDARAIARERVTDELKRSVVSSSQSLPSILIALSALISIGRGQGDASTFSAWFCSVITFIELAADPSHKHRVQPIFQISISSCTPCPSLSRSLLSLLSITSSPSLLSFFDTPIGHRQDLYGLATQGIPRSLIDRLLGLTNEKIKEQIPVRTLRLLACALDVDPVVVEIIEDEMNKEYKNEETKMIGELIEKCNGPMDVEEVVLIFSSLSVSDQLEWRPRLKRRCERLARDADDDVRSSILSSLCVYSLCVSSLNSSRSLSLPSSYDYLPKTSLLRAVIEKIINSNTPGSSSSFLSCGHLVDALVGIKRSDGRSLPPIDCSFLLPYENDQRYSHTVMRIIVQQADTKQLSRLLSEWNNRECRDEEISSLIHSLSYIISTMGERVTQNVMMKLMEASKTNENILHDLSPFMDCPVVHDTVISSLRPIDSPYDLDQPPLKRVSGFQKGYGSLGWLFDILVESKRCDITGIRKILGLLKGRGSMWSNGSASMISYSLCGQSSSDIRSKIIDLLNVSNITKNNSTMERKECLSHLWELFTIFVISSNLSPIPFPFFSLEINDQSIFERSLRYLVRHSFDRYLQRLNEEKSSLINQITSFVIECLEVVDGEGAKESKFSISSLRLFIRLLIRYHSSSKLQQLLIRTKNWKLICTPVHDQ